MECNLATYKIVILTYLINQAENKHDLQATQYYSILSWLPIWLRSSNIPIPLVMAPQSPPPLLQYCHVFDQGYNNQAFHSDFNAS
jgi:hypothetical protein